MHFYVSLKDLEDIEGRILSGGSDEEIIQRLRHVYEFLPAETIISIADGIVSIDIPERVISNKLEAIRLHEKASLRAKSGEYAKAISIWQRVLQLDPTYVEARRDLGMALMEVNQLPEAKEHLIEAATLSSLSFEEAGIQGRCRGLLILRC
jgi:tetratricopeptide (TPR) repeat protein